MPDLRGPQPSTGLVGVLGSTALTALALIPRSVVTSGPALCPSRLVTGVPCPGCGMVRACSALMHGDFASAWAFHPFSFLVVALIIGSLVASLLRYRARRPDTVALSDIPLPLLVAVAVVWLTWGVARAINPPAWA